MLAKFFDSDTDYAREIAEKYAPDYPNVKNVPLRELLWALESTLEGTNASCDDMHKIIKKLNGGKPLTPEQWQELVKDNPMDEEVERNETD